MGQYRTRRWWKAKPKGWRCSRELMRRHLAACATPYGYLPDAYHEVLRASWESGCMIRYKVKRSWREWDFMLPRTASTMKISPGLVFRVGVEVEPIYEEDR